MANQNGICTFITKFHGHFSGMKIHISESTKRILETFHDYTITERGETEVKVSIYATTPHIPINVPISHGTKLIEQLQFGNFIHFENSSLRFITKCVI